MLPESNWHLEIKANWPRLSAILFLRLKTLQLTLLSKKKFCQIVASSLWQQSIWQEIFFDKLFNIQDWERIPKAKKCLLWESFAPLCNTRKLLLPETKSYFFLLKLKKWFGAFLSYISCKKFPKMTYTVWKTRNCQIEWANFVKKGSKRGLWKSKSHKS